MKNIADDKIKSIEKQIEGCVIVKKYASNEEVKLMLEKGMKVHAKSLKYLEDK